MTELFAITTSNLDGASIDTVNARELHTHLKSKQKFTDWIKNRIEKYEFEEGKDFCFINLGSKGRGGHNALEYHLSLDMAKELAMVENNDQGRQARRYFIECEKKAKSGTKPIIDFNNPAQMRQLMLDSLDQLIEYKEEIAELTPKADAYNLIAVADGSLNVTEAAKALQMRPKDLFAHLSQNGWIYKRVGGGQWLGYQAAIQKGLLEHKIIEISRSDGSTQIREQVRILPKGLTKLAEMFVKS